MLISVDGNWCVSVYMCDYTVLRACIHVQMPVFEGIFLSSKTALMLYIYLHGYENMATEGQENITENCKTRTKYYSESI